jgi:CYTH domain-containing protein
MTLALARPKTAHEIERKFLVKELPPNLNECESRPIQQGYFAVKRDGTQVRLRKSGTEYSLTFKRGRGLKRHEWEVALIAEQFNELWPTTEGRRLRKTRTTCPAAITSLKWIFTEALTKAWSWPKWNSTMKSSVP